MPVINITFSYLNIKSQLVLSGVGFTAATEPESMPGSTMAIIFIPLPGSALLM
jgi:hypothetical protein